MKLGFLDSIFNYADVYEDAVKAIDAKIPSVNMDRMTAPHLLKIPLFSKMLFRNGCDAIVVFLTMLPEDSAELDLVHEKIIDLEVAEGKGVFFCIISGDEFDNEGQLKEMMAQRLGLIAEAIAKIVASPSSLSGDIANTDLTNAMTMFGAPAEQAQEQKAEPEPTEGLQELDLGVDSSKSLF
ncbi:MAG: hypothetical protein ABIG96_03565 [Candidatus Micrarchaeota archaeon]